MNPIFEKIIIYGIILVASIVVSCSNDDQLINSTYELNLSG